MRGKDRVRRNNKECSTTMDIILLPLILGGKRRKGGTGALHGTRKEQRPRRTRWTFEEQKQLI